MTGGFRLGLEMAGHECVGHVEIDKYAHKSYVAMHKPKEEEYYADDIRNVKPEDLPDFDILTGGFPCQSFSIAGKRGGFTDTRGTLFFEIMRIASIRKPKYLFLENVKGLLSHDGGKTFGTILSTLWECGYDAEWQVCNSKNYGVPQNRERVFIIGHLRGAGGGQVFPIGGSGGTAAENRVIGINNPKKTREEFKYESINRFYDSAGLSPTLDTMGGGNREPKVAIPVLTPDRLEKRQNGRRFKEDGEPSFTLTAQDKHGVMVETEIKETSELKFVGGVKEKDWVGNGKKLSRNYPQGERIYDSEGIATALTSKGVGGSGGQTGLYKTNGMRIRKLTPKECFRLQGFPDEYFERAVEVNSNSQLYKQAGNSVTVPVIYEIGRRLK